MVSGKALTLGPSSTQCREDHIIEQRGHKRKFSSLLRYTQHGLTGYPSPPMSTPPSPSRPPPELSYSAVAPPTTISIPPASTTVSTLPSLPSTLPGFQFAPPGFPPHASYVSPFPSQAGAPYRTPASVPGGFQLEGGANINTSAASTNVSDSPASRSGRKSRGHVASACINCKKAHLSCDIQRPCARCVASGKQDTCVDVQHKKRGRPRLREESEFKIGQMLPGPIAVPPPAAIASSPPSARPIAGSRHRRTESLRSLRSQTSDSSGPSALPTPTFPRPPVASGRFGLQPPPFPSASLAALEIPTAYLDLDLTVIRANNAFQHAMSSGQDIRGRRIDDVAIAADNNNFQTLRNQLRAEREAREPTYMPPILQYSQDPLQGISDVDIERLVQGFIDRTYIWWPSQPGAARERFTVRVRLAKANIYFVVVTLPPVRQMQPVAPMLSPRYAMPSTTAPENYQVYAPGAAATAPPRYYDRQPIPGPPLLMQQGYAQPSAPFNQPAYEQPRFEQYQQYHPPIAPLPAVVGSAAEPMGIAAMTDPRTIAAPPSSALQLPPLPGPPPMTMSSSVAEPSGSHQARASSSEEDEDVRSPKKRRRVGIDDVLQR